MYLDGKGSMESSTVAGQRRGQKCSNSQDDKENLVTELFSEYE